MKIQKFNHKIAREEQETSINYGYYNSYNDHDTIITTTIMRDYNTLLKKGYTLVEQYQYTDGTVCGGRFVCDSSMITFRTPPTEEQLVKKQEQARKVFKTK